MSYTKHIHDVITLSKTVTFTDSQGQSHSREVTLHEPIDIYVEVDTSPFDSSVRTCNAHVQGLTASVALFQAGEIEAKQQSAQDICDATTKGFFGVIDQNISIQNAEEEAQMTALAGELIQQSKELARKQTVMSGDYNRIKERYSKLFDDLNGELKNRIYSLLAPCFDFVERATAEQRRKVDSSLLSTVVVDGDETAKVRTAIAASHVKSNAVNLINSAKDYIDSQAELAGRIAAVLCDEGSEATYKVPVMVVESSSDETHGDTQVIMHDTTRRLGVTEQAVRQSVMGSTADFRQEDKQKIDNYFFAALDAYNDGDSRKARVAEVVRRLYAGAGTMTYA